MALDTLIAGAYVGTWNAVAMGITRQGYELSAQTKAEMIDETDVYGGTTIDWVWRGLDVFMQATYRAYKAGPVSAFWPYHGTLGVMGDSAAPIGRLASDIAKALVLTATPATPAAASPATLTGAKSLLAPNFDARLLFDSRLREVPVRLQLLPFAVSDAIKHFTTT